MLCWAYQMNLKGSYMRVPLLSQRFGMSRRNFPKSEIDEVKRAYSILFDENEIEFKSRIKKLNEEKFESSSVKIITNFVSVETNRAYVSPSEV